MLTQFYGTVYVNGSAAAIDDSAAHSNNFSVEYVGTGHTRVTLNEWLAYQPCVSVTPQFDTTAEHNAYACYQVSQTSQQYVLDIYTAYHYPSNDRLDVPYSFALVCGTRLDTDLESGQPLALTARILELGPAEASVLVLSTECNGASRDLDKGTVLAANTPDESVTLMLTSSTVTDGYGTTYSLQGYTYSTGLATPAEWQDNAYPVAVPSNTGISSPMQSFRVTATAADGTVLASDPIAIIKKRGS